MAWLPVWGAAMASGEFPAPMTTVGAGALSERRVRA